MLHKHQAALMPVDNRVLRKVKASPPENLLEIDGEEGLMLLEDGEGIELNE